jgi:hypothetical protein
VWGDVEYIDVSGYTHLLTPVHYNGYVFDIRNINVPDENIQPYREGILVNSTYLFYWSELFYGETNYILYDGDEIIGQSAHPFSNTSNFCLNETTAVIDGQLNTGGCNCFDVHLNDAYATINGTKETTLVNTGLYSTVLCNEQCHVNRVYSVYSTIVCHLTGKTDHFPINHTCSTGS